MKILLIGIIFFYLFAQPVFATTQKEVWRDNFDTGSLSGWQEIRNIQFDNPDLPCRGQNSDVYRWDVQESQAHLKISGSVPCSVVLLPQNVNIADPSSLAVSFQYRPLSSFEDHNWMLLWQDKDNYLGFHIFGDSIFPEKHVENVSWPIGNPGNFHFQDGETYQVRLEYDASLRRIRIFINEGPISEWIEPYAQPQLLTGIPALAGSVGIGVNHSEAWYDNFTIWQFGEKHTTPVSLLSQINPLWKNDTYDKANLWSLNKETIGRWGCALVSATMILRSYGIRQLPDGSELLPDSLNTWLSGQPDGYFGEGTLNWRSLTRLSALYAKTHNTPDLEFESKTIPISQQIPWLVSELSQSIPVILAEPDHFIVAYGSGYGEANINIRDPFYPSENLTDYQNTFLSARVFTPAHTDLSAITLVASPEMKLIFRDTEGNVLQPDSTLIERPLVNLEEKEIIGKNLMIYEFLKTNDQTISVETVNSNQTTEPLTILTYQQNGEVQRENYLSLSPNQPLAIEYHRNSASTLPSPPILSPISEVELLDLLNQGEINSPFLVQNILELQTKIQDSDGAEQLAWKRTLLLQLTDKTRNGWLRFAAENWVLRHFFPPGQDWFEPGSV